MTQTDNREPPLARLVGRRPNRGAADAAKVVLADVQQLVRAEIDLAKAEVAHGVKSKAQGAGLFIGAAIVGWLAIQAFLVFLGFVFATFMPAWAASGMVLLLLLIIIGVLGWLGMKKVQVKASLETTKTTVEQSKQAASQAVDQAKANAKQGVDEAKETLATTAADLKGRVDAARGRSTTTAAATPTPAPSEPAAVPSPPTSPNPQESSS